MTVYTLDPLADGRWAEFLDAHPQASIFHTPGWLRCLQQTYGYSPFVLTTTAPGSPLTNGVVFCRVKSWLTGERMVSVPFADHCQPLFEQSDDFLSVLEYATQVLGNRGRKRVEIRPLDDREFGLAQYPGFREAESFRLHLLDLAANEDELLKACDKDSVQRRLRRAN